MERGKTRGLAQVLLEIIDDEESDDWVREWAREVLESLLQKERIGGTEEIDRKSLLDFLEKSLNER